MVNMYDRKVNEAVLLVFTVASNVIDNQNQFQTIEYFNLVFI